MMMDETAQNKLIDDYIMNRLNDDERKTFEARLEQDTALSEAVKIRQVMIDQVKTIGNLQLKDKILQIQKKVEGQGQHTAKRRRILTIVSVAAAAVVLLFIGFQWFNVAPSNSSLYTSNYEAYEELRFGSRSTQEDKTLIDAGALYKKKNYEEALKAFDNLDAESKKDERVILASAICHMELKNYEKAIIILKQTSALTEFLYEDQAKWYMALAYLKLDQKKESKLLLQDLSHTSSFYTEKANALLNEFE